MILSQAHKGALFAMASGFCFGLIGYFGISVVNTGLSISTMLFWRFFVSGLVMLALSFRKLYALLTSPLEKTGRQAAGHTLIFGALLYIPSTMSYFFASTYIGTGLAMVLFFTFPVFVMIINRFYLKTNMSSHTYSAIAIIILGMLLLVDWHGAQFDLIGILLSLAAASLYGLYVVVSKKAALQPLPATAILSVGCLMSSFTVSILTSSFAFPPTLVSWGYIIGMGLICTALPILFFLKSLAAIGSAKASILSVLEPIFALFFGVLLLKEEITALQLLGAAITLSGAALVLFDRKNSKKR